jgi:UDP-N-acetylmuramate--alanine ligase
MNLNEVKRVYFLGIGGIGMSALARYFKNQGAQVSGYDKTPSNLTQKLEAEGISIHFDESISHVDLEADLYVYTPAIPVAHPALETVKNNGGNWFKRSQVLQWIAEQSKTLAISGTHGKTTTSAYLSHIMHQVHGKTTGFVGGIMNNYNSNLITASNSEFTVVEADEYDKSFLRLSPDVAVITSLDPDHLDIYGTFDQMKIDYQTFAASANQLLVHKRLSADFPEAKTYSCDDNDVDYVANSIRVQDSLFYFEVKYQKELLDKFNTQLPGKHNIENALAAISVAHVLGLNMDSVAHAVASFRGVNRRFDRVYESASVRLVDDYAHHPVEIDAAISAARDLYPNTKITVLFQPHLFSRTRDLEDDFVKSLDNADEVVLLPIYPAREKPIEGVSSDNLLKKLSLKTKLLVQKTHLSKAVLSLSPETVLVLGAGDIDRCVNPLAKALKDWVEHVE